MNYFFVLITLFFCNLLVAQTYEVEEVKLVAKVQNMEGINTRWAEFSPFVIGEDIYFTSSRQFNQNNVGEDNWEKIAYLNLFNGRVKTFGSDIPSVKDVSLFSNKLNFGIHTGPASFTPSGDTIFFTRVVRLNDDGEKTFRSQIYMAIKHPRRKKWIKIKKMPFCENSSSYAYPSYDSGSKRLYFSSNRAGGKGKYDIYYVDVMNEEWSTPINYENVNSTQNETHPFAINENLFFSSDKKGGKGGLDIYFSAPEPADLPVEIEGLNSAGNDFGIFLIPDLSAGYFSSDRNGNDDIFYCTISRRVTVKNQLAGTFTFRSINTAASDLTVQILNDEGEFMFEQKTDENGYFLFDNINLDNNYSVRLNGAETEDMKLEFYDENGETIADFLLNESGAFKYKKIFYDKRGIIQFLPEDMIDMDMDVADFSGKLVVETDPKTPLTNLTIDLVNDQREVVMTTQTDAHGNFNFEELDMNQTYFVNIPNCDKDMLLYVYSDEGRIYTQLKCNTQDFFLYQRLSGTKSNRLSLIKETKEEEFMLNRSEVFGRFVSHDSSESVLNKEVHVYNDAGEYMGKTRTDSSGYFYLNHMSAESTYKFTVKDMKDPTLTLYNRFGKEVAIIEREENNYFIFRPLGYKGAGNLDVLEEDDISFILDISDQYNAITVYYDSDETQPISTDMAKLEKLLALLKKHPPLNLSINAYADATASDEYNFLLSQKRGRWILQYLIKNGIDAKRLTVNAYGETQLINPENDAVNRRAELRIYQ